MIQCEVQHMIKTPMGNLKQIRCPQAATKNIKHEGVLTTSMNVCDFCLGRLKDRDEEIYKQLAITELKKEKDND